MTETSYTLRSNLAAADYEAIIWFCIRISEHAAFVLRQAPTKESLSFLEEIASAFAFERSVTEWPGTRTFGKPVREMLYRSTPGLARALLRHPSFSDWQQPELPEDLHFLRSDGSVLLGSIAQHADAWMSLTPQELDDLEESTPGLLGRVRAVLRDLTQYEGSILEQIEHAWAESDRVAAGALRQQRLSARVLDGASSPSLVVEVESAASPLAIPDGILPVELDIFDTDGRDVGNIRLWVSEGYLEGLELSWWDGRTRSLEQCASSGYQLRIVSRVESQSG